MLRPYGRWRQCRIDSALKGPQRGSLTFKTLSLAADDLAYHAAPPLPRHRSLLIQNIAKFSHLSLEAGIVHDIADFHQNAPDQGRIIL